MKRKAFHDCESAGYVDDLLAAFDFYLFLRHEIHEIRFPWGKPHITPRTPKYKLDELDREVRATIAKRHPNVWSSHRHLLREYRATRDRVLGAFGRLAERFVEDIVSRIPCKWREAFEQARQSAGLCARQCEPLANHANLLVRFALAWHATNRKALSAVYQRSQGLPGRWNVDYALSRNASTPPAVAKNLVALKGAENKPISNRARELV
jgi:hypothetical protein